MFTTNDEKLHHISAQDHARITDAIRCAEKLTSGEIYAVVAHQSDSYFYIAGFMAALWTFVAAAIFVLVSWWWNIEYSAGFMVSAQIAVFTVSLLCIWFLPALRYLLVPRSVAYRRASRNAVNQFFAHGIHTTSDRSGVLLFISLAEHYAQVIADAGINDKVEQSEWDSMISVLTSHAAKGELTEGFVIAIERAGDLLAQHFPPVKGAKNELDDRLVEI